MENQADDYLDNHYIHKSNWLRAAVLGANDGILSTSSLAIGVAAASDLRDPIVLATLAGLVAGALGLEALGVVVAILVSNPSVYVPVALENTGVATFST